jgi:hypothetical protein
MPSSFLICYPDVPLSALTVTTNQPSSYFDTDYPVVSLFSGHRHNYFQLGINVSLLEINFDLGTGNSRSIDHLIVGGCQVLISDAIATARLQGSNDGVSYTNILGGTSNFTSRTFNGPDSDDLIYTSAYNNTLTYSATSYRYFKMILQESSGVSSFAFSKLYFGASFDMGMEPSTYDMEVTTENDSDTWKAERGHTLMTKAFHPKHRFTIEWDGVTDAKATEFQQRILSNPYRDYVWLYATTHQDPLYDNRLVYCRVVDAECEIVKEEDNYNNIKAVFEESI